MFLVDWNDYGIDDNAVSSVVHGTPVDWFAPHGWRVVGTERGMEWDSVTRAVLDGARSENPGARDPDLAKVAIVEDKLDRLRDVVREKESALVCFSGGVDSTFLLRVAHDVLGDRAVALTAVSPAVPRREVEEARTLAASIWMLKKSA